MIIDAADSETLDKYLDKSIEEVHIMLKDTKEEDKIKVTYLIGMCMGIGSAQMTYSAHADTKSEEQLDRMFDEMLYLFRKRINKLRGQT